MRASRQMLAKIGHVVCIGGVIVTAMLIGQIPALAASEGANVLFILDGSGSMWGRLENVEKIVIAKERMTELVQELEGVNMGLIVYGHRRKGDCDDIEMMVPLGSGNQKAIIQKIQSVNPKGKTPIQRSIALAAQHLETLEEETEIVLVSDGLETCDEDPCGYVKTLKDKGIKFTLDVVGFDVKDEEREQLECLANAGDGRYYSAKNAMQLKEAFTEVKKEVVKKVETKPAGPQPGDVWTEAVTGMEFVWIPGGCFQMGQSEQDSQHLLERLKTWAGGDVQKAREHHAQNYKQETPQHRVCLDGFWLGKYEVTNAQYQIWNASHDSNNPETSTLKDQATYPLDGDMQPVVSVSWEEADAFTDWLTDQQNGPYTFRLPTEAEWEYAARAGTTTSRFWGDDPNQACRYANVYDQTLERVLKNNWYLIHQCDDGYVVTAPVGSFRPNAFGLHDMIGNVWEWCNDWYDAQYYADSPSHSPEGPSTGKSRVIRGGAWNFLTPNCRAASRMAAAPTDRGDVVGFRVVRTP